MRKTISCILTLIIIFSTVFCVPAFTAEATVYEPDQTLYSEAYMLVNLDDTRYPVVAEKNADEKMYPASLTKIVTAMVTLNKVDDLSQEAVMSQAAYDESLGTGAQTAGIGVGESLSIEALLYLTMVYSACDACEVLAEYVSGSKEAFVAEMNSWVRSLGCYNTNFVNPDGLHDPNHYTTARDLSLISIAAVNNLDFMKFACETEVSFHGYTLPHTNLMLHPGYKTYYYEYAQGIKTGFTTEAGHCLITKASKNGYNYLAIILNAPRQNINGENYPTKCNFIDAITLFDWAFDNLKYTTLIQRSEVVGEVSVVDGKDADTVQLVAKDDVNEIVPAALDKSAIIVEYADKPEHISAPVIKGEQVCVANIIYGDEVIAKVDLVAADNVELSTFLKVINALKAFVASPIVKVILILVFLFVIAYIALFVSRLKRKQTKKKKIEKRNESRDLYIDEAEELEPPKRR